MSANDDYTEQDAARDSAASEATEGYESRTGQSEIPVQADSAPVDDPIDEETADSDEQLARDDEAAIDKDNILEERTRGAAQPKGTYREPGDDEGIPTDDGTSSN